MGILRSSPIMIGQMPPRCNGPWGSPHSGSLVCTIAELHGSRFELASVEGQDLTAATATTAPSHQVLLSPSIPAIPVKKNF